MNDHPDGNAVAERQHNAEQARRESFMPTFEEALADLLGKLMDGEEYPRGGRVQIDRLYVLEQCGSAELAGIINATLCGNYALAHDNLENRVEKIVRDSLEGERSWVEMRQQDMADEAEQDSE